MYGRPAQSTRYASRLTAMSSPNQRTYSCESAWQPIHITSVAWNVVSRCSRVSPSLSASRVAMTAARSTCSAGWPSPRSIAIDSAASSSVRRVPTGEPDTA